MNTTNQRSVGVKEDRLEIRRWNRGWGGSRTSHTKSDYERNYRCQASNITCTWIKEGNGSILCSTFRCTICLDLIKMFAGCCQNILGCQQCTIKLYHGDDGRTKKCPRAHWGLSKTTHINGFDELLKQRYRWVWWWLNKSYYLPCISKVCLSVVLLVVSRVLRYYQLVVKFCPSVHFIHVPELLSASIDIHVSGARKHSTG